MVEEETDPQLPHAACGTPHNKYMIGAVGRGCLHFAACSAACCRGSFCGAVAGDRHSFVVTFLL